MASVDGTDGDPRGREDSDSERGAELLERALELPEAQREEFVRSACRDDPELLRRLLAFLRGKPSSKLAPGAPGIVARVMGTGRTERIGDCDMRELLGAGAMGTVYRARQEPPGRDVAIKVLHGAVAADERGLQRFLGEGKKLLRLDHPGIVRVHDLGEDRGRYFMVMELVPGHDLGVELGALRGEGPGVRILPEPRTKEYFRAVADLVRQAAEALQHAHDHKLVHRDVKPQNLLLAPDRRVKLTDLGIARDTTEGTLTRTGEVVGTPHYMSPEQASRERVRVDHRTDVYSLGVVLYELLTLRRPFDGPTSMHVFDQIANGQAVPPRTLDARVPRELEAVCMQAIARAPEARYASAAEFAADLARYLAGEPVSARILGWSDHVLRFARKHRRALVAAGLVAVGSVAAFGAALATKSPSRERDLALRVESALEAAPGGERALVEELRRAMEEGWVERDDANAVTLLARSAEHARGLEQRARERLSLARAARLGDFTRAHTTWDEDLREAASAVEALRAYVPSLPEDLGHEQVLPASVVVRIRVETTSGIPVKLAAAPLDVFTGRPSDARWVEASVDADGALRATVPEGPVRFYVVQEGHGFAEIARQLLPGDGAIELTARVRPERESAAGLVAVSASRCQMRTSLQKLDAPGRERVEYDADLAAFLLEPEPVTNGELARFLTERGRELPTWWPSPVPEAWLALPATRVDHVLATEYAESLGLRLPTQAEWLLAARGPDYAVLPPGIDRARLESGAVKFGVPGPRPNPTTGPEAEAEIVRWLLANFPPAGHQRGVAWAPGVNDVFGPIVEWTDSWFFDRTDRGLASFTEQRFLLGATTEADLEKRLSIGYGFGIFKPARTSDSFTGFRCARSAGVPEIR